MSMDKEHSGRSTSSPLTQSEPDQPPISSSSGETDEWLPEERELEIRAQEIGWFPLRVSISAD